MITLGYEVKDVITGFTGIVVAYAEHLHNCDRAAVQPRELKDGSPVDALWFDVPQLELVGARSVPVQVAAILALKLGDEVADSLSPFKGKVTGIATWINGCRRVGVTPNKMKDSHPVDDVWFAASQLTLV